MRHWLQRTVKTLTKKAWIAALALFYLYNEAAVRFSTIVGLDHHLLCLSSWAIQSVCVFQCYLLFEELRFALLQAKLPWVRIKRFENWFWTTVRCRWLHASNAATVLGRKWWKDTCGNFSWRNTTEGMARKASRSSPSNHHTKIEMM